jgi:hypothetical protein
MGSEKKVYKLEQWRKVRKEIKGKNEKVSENEEN